MRKGVFFKFSFVKQFVNFQLLLFPMWKIDEEVNVNSLRESKKEREEQNFTVMPNPEGVSHPSA